MENYLGKSSTGVSDIPLPSLVNFGLVLRSYCHLNRAGSKGEEVEGILGFAGSLRGGSAEYKLRSGSGCFLTRRAIIFARLK